MSMLTRSMRTPVVASLSAMAIFGLSQMAWADEVYEMDVNNWTSASHHYTKNVWDPWTKWSRKRPMAALKSTSTRAVPWASLPLFIRMYGGASMTLGWLSLTTSTIPSFSPIPLAIYPLLWMGPTVR